MNTLILASAISKWDFSGIFCLASILFLFIALLAYSAGPISGSCTCLFFFVICLFATADSSQSGASNVMFVTNKTQTKWLRQDELNRDEDGGFYMIDRHNTVDYDELIVPAKEIYRVDGVGYMKSSREPLTADLDENCYIYNTAYPKMNVASEHGGGGVPQWLYHPASAFWIFGIGGLPALLGGMFLAAKVL